jgi:GT2 family glycosyltransferase
MNNRCSMIRDGNPFGANGNGGGGGSMGVVAEQSIIIRRTAAIGDVLCSTVVADKLIDQGFSVSYQAHPAMHCVLRRHPKISDIAEPNGYAHVNLDQSYERDPQRRIKHFHQMFMETAGQQLLARGVTVGPPLNCCPSIRMRPNDVGAMRQRFEQYPKPWIMVCPRSDSYNVRQVPDGIWDSAAQKINGTKFWLGRHPAPPHFVDLHCQHFDTVMSYISVADVMVSVDTGPLHVAAALGIPIVALGQSSSPELHLSDQRDFITIEPKLDCLNCQSNYCPVNQFMPPCQHFDPDFIAAWVNAKLRILDTENVAAIVAVYQPDAGTLNQCLEKLLPQVQEIVVTAEANSRVPPEAIRNEKIRYVRKPMARIGYGRNVNFGARQSTGKYLLLCNDDVFLNPGAVEAMKREMVGNVGMVANLLRYPEGTIYHAGKVRQPGVRGWGHIDHRMVDPTIREATEMENVCGACVLVRRKAFYEIKGFDEDFFIYAEDDDFALRLRRAGYRIIYTPHSTGIHMEHQSTRKLDSIHELVKKANGLFGQKWGRYFDHNSNRIPGTFDY